MSKQGEMTRKFEAVPTVGHLPANAHVRNWLTECVNLCRPDHIHILDGSAEEKHALLQRAVADGVLIRLNQDKLPGCYLHRSNSNDVARTEHCTYICTQSENLAGATNNWMPPRKAYDLLGGLFAGCMRGRT